MTKERDAASREDALMLVLGQLRTVNAAAVLDCHPSYLQACSDPDKREELSVRDLELLDLAHQAQFGRGFPLYEALGRRLATYRAERFADAAAIGRHGATLARETGEAVPALVEASLVPGDQDLLEEALRQTEDVARAATATMASIRTALGRARAPPDTS